MIFYKREDKTILRDIRYRFVKYGLKAYWLSGISWNCKSIPTFLRLQEINFNGETILFKLSAGADRKTLNCIIFVVCRRGEHTIMSEELPTRVLWSIVHIAHQAYNSKLAEYVLTGLKNDLFFDDWIKSRIRIAEFNKTLTKSVIASRLFGF